MRSGPAAAAQRKQTKNLPEGGRNVTKYRAQFIAVHKQARRSRVQPNNTAKHQQQHQRQQQQLLRLQSHHRRTPLVVVCVVSLVVVRAVEAAGWRWAALRTTRWGACRCASAAAAASAETVEEGTDRCQAKGGPAPALVAEATAWLVYEWQEPLCLLLF